MNNIVLGILAHVDAGKTTLSESILYESGTIRTLGRVDKQDAFLDTNKLERARGITIFSKQALFRLGEKKYTLLDTPGHVDFAAEMERTLQVLDYAILVISGADGVQGHTRTLWKLLQQYHIPVFLFINKMDQEQADRTMLFQQLQEELSSCCVDFTEENQNVLGENIAVCNELLLERFLASGSLEQSDIITMIHERKIFPCFFGSALKVTGIATFLQGIETYTISKAYGDIFGARVYKITRDEQGNRLTYLKVTGGTLRVKTVIGAEKVNQIRLYSGEKYETRDICMAGDVCAVTGLIATKAGEGLGSEKGIGMTPILEPVMTYRLVLPEEVNVLKMLPNIRMLEEEIPEIHVKFDEEHQEIQIQMMGEVQTEILLEIIEEQFHVRCSFQNGSIVYKETIANVVEGVGHFEPLRHYAEVHLVLEPLEVGSGLVFDTICSEDMLGRNWQRLIMTHMAEKVHVGILTGSAITDMKITLVAGRSHPKHTEGGDFRQATYRAIRQGIRQAESILLEPVYAFKLEIPDQMVGKAMTDIENMAGKFGIPDTRDGKSILEGIVPVSEVKDYQMQLRAYTKGEGKLSLILQGYRPCHNTEEVMKQIQYEPDQDLENTADSVFCAHGAGFIVPWYEVPAYMHLESVLQDTKKAGAFDEEYMNEKRVLHARELSIGREEMEEILNRASGANKKQKGDLGRNTWNRFSRTESRTITAETAGMDRESYQEALKKNSRKEEYLLVDGYNIIFAWKELQELAKVNINSARDRLIDILSNYQGFYGMNLILVFDAYKVRGGQGSVQRYHNIDVVYTKEAETADRYIERTSHDLSKKGNVTVATSDGMIQMIIWGAGARRISARELEVEIARTSQQIREVGGITEIES